MTLPAPLLSAILHGALCAALEAGAASDTRILVVPALDSGADPASASARAEELYTGLRAAGLLPVSVEERAGVDLALAPEPVRGTNDGARGALQEARARLRELDAEGARGAADRALDELVRLDRPEDALELFADTLLFRANLALVEGRDEDATADLELLARLEPSRAALDPGLYPPSLVDAYEKARAVPEGAQRATLVVRARAAGFGGTRVLVDARPWDGAPLSPGPHLITVRAEGAAPRSELRVLDASAPAILEPFLAPAGAGARRAALTQQARGAPTPELRARALAALAEQCAARAVVLERGAELVLFVPGRPLSTLRPPARDGATIGRVVLAALQPPRTSAVGETPEDLGPSPALVWGAVTAGAAVLVIGVAGGVGAWALWPESAPPPPPLTVTVSAFTD